jgi:DnaJ-class molecular chaperone
MKSAAKVCPNCHGTGLTRFGVCTYCNGSGK